MRLFERVLRISMCTGLALGLVACTRPKTTNANVSLQLPIPERAAAGRNSKGANTTPPVQVIILNITGSGMSQPFFWQWNANNQDSTATPPTSISVTVPTGTPLLIQALVVEQDNNTGEMIFNYGDQSATISAADSDVNITVAQMGGAVNGQGNIIGRYLSTATTGPTGLYNVMFPPPGKPPMIVQQGEIFGGYLNTFGLQAVALTYAMTGGQILFANAMLTPSSSNPLLSSTNPAATALIYVPTTYRCENEGGPCVTAAQYDENQAQLYVMGYFGPGVGTNNKMCYDATTAVPIDAGYVFGDISNLANPVAMTWQSSPLFTAAGLATETNAGLLSGGTPYSACSSSTPFTDYLYLQTSNVTNGSSALMFQGPYQGSAQGNSGSSYLQFNDAESSPGGLTVTWQYSPGAAADLTGSEVFYLANPSNTSQGSWDQPYHSQNSNGFFCSRLVSDFQFVSAGTVAASASQQSITIPNMDTTSNVEVIVCPYQFGLLSGTTYYQSAVDGNPGQNSQGGPNGNTFNMAFQWHAATSNGSVTYANNDTTQSIVTGNNCKAYTVTTVDLSGTPTPVAAATSISIFDNGVMYMGMQKNLNFYPNSGCTGTPNSLSIGANSTTTTVWVDSSPMGMYNATGIDSIYITTAAAPIQSLTTLLALTNSTSPPSSIGLNWLTLNNGLANSGLLAVGSCYGISVDLMDINNVPVPSNGSLNISLASSLPGQFFADPTCNTPLSPNPISMTNATVSEVYFSPTAIAGGPGAISATAAAMTAGSLSISQVGSINPVQLVIAPAGMFAAGMCTYVQFEVLDEVGAVVQNANVANLSTIVTGINGFGNATAGGQFFTSGACTSGGMSTVSGLQLGGSSPPPNVEFQITPGAFEIDFTATSSSVPTTTTRFSNLWAGGPNQYAPLTSVPTGQGSAIQVQYQLLDPTTGVALNANPHPGTCYPLMVYMEGAGSTFPAIYGSDVTVPLALSNGLQSVAALYSDSNCASALPANTTVIHTGTSFTTIYFEAVTSISNCSGVPEISPASAIHDALSNTVGNMNGAEICPQ